MILPNKVYDILKWLVTLFIPALAVFYGKLAVIWQLPYVDEIPNTLIALDAFLGAILCISSIQYDKQSKEFDKLNGGDVK